MPDALIFVIRVPMSQTALSGVPVISALDAAGLDARIAGFAELMSAAVHAGASIGYILPFGQRDGEAFWSGRIRAGLVGGKLHLVAATLDDRVVGTCQLDWDTPPNQPHRAEVRKLLVHPDFRRRGIARLLMEAIEAQARELGRSLLTLDTRTGDHAEPLYASLGYSVCGVIPDYCIDAVTGALDSTTVMYKRIGPAA